jgi:cytoskeletal protein RodZ
MVEVIGLAVAGLLFVWWQLRDVAQAAKRTREQEEAQAQAQAQAQASQSPDSPSPGNPSQDAGQPVADAGALPPSEGPRT